MKITVISDYESIKQFVGKHERWVLGLDEIYSNVGYGSTQSRNKQHRNRQNRRQSSYM